MPSNNVQMILGTTSKKQQAKTIKCFKGQHRRILHLTLLRKWFDDIACGDKIFEYREIKPYWQKRLMNEDTTFIKFDEIHFKNGYNKDAPFMRVKHLATTCKMFEGERMFAIELGKILEIKFP